MRHEPVEDAWAAFDAALEAIADPLIESLDAFHAAGVPEGAQYVVVWVPLGPPDFLKLTYMDKVDVLAWDGPQPVAVNRQLASLVDALPERSASRAHETVFEWIRRAMACSSFARAPLRPILAVNNACAYFDLATLEPLEERELFD